MFGIFILGILFGICGTLVGERIYSRWYYKDFDPNISELSEEEWEELVSTIDGEEFDNGNGNE